MGSVLHADGSPYPDADVEDGRAIDRLTDQKYDKYPELVLSDRVHYVVLACEEGGRWGPDVFRVVEDLVKLKVAPLSATVAGRRRRFLLPKSWPAVARFVLGWILPKRSAVGML